MWCGRGLAVEPRVWGDALSRGGKFHQGGYLGPPANRDNMSTSLGREDISARKIPLLGGCLYFTRASFLLFYSFPFSSHPQPPLPVRSSLGRIPSPRYPRRNHIILSCLSGPARPALSRHIRRLDHIDIIYHYRRVSTAGGNQTTPCLFCPGCDVSCQLYPSERHGQWTQGGLGRVGR